jgi:hypothetical protein
VKLLLLSVLALSTVCGTAAAADAFDGLACDADIAKALKGCHLPDGPAEAIETAHKNLGLKNLGGDELDWGSEVWWKICGATYAALVDQHLILRDVLKVPAEPGISLAFEGACKGGPKDKEVIAVVEDKAGAADLPAKAAWKIDDAKKRYVPVPPEGILCPRGDGIVDSWK